MILIFNTIVNEKARDHFSNTIAYRITFGKPYRIIFLEDELPDPKEFSHLLISGSELSAAMGSEWDDKIISVIRSFLDNGKPILAICHGHQMLVRAIAGNRVCRRSEEPEFGWKKLIITDNPLFEGITEPVFLESRYDEVCDLPEEFNIIACNNKTEVQAFQYKDLQVWGVQFHPEMLLREGNEMLERHLTQNPQDRKYLGNEINEPEKVKDNLHIFLNFLKISHD